MRCCVLGLLAAIAGCATPYQKMGLSGGYDDFRVTENEFEVTFRGNGYTSEERVSRFILRRAAEVTLANGFTHFIPVSQEDRTRVSMYHSSHGTANAYAPPGSHSAYAYGSSSGITHPIVKPATAMRIRCYKSPPPGIDGIIAARAFLEYNFPESLTDQGGESPQTKPAS